MTIAGQVPIMALSAHAFLFTISLAADTSKTARIMSMSLSFLITLMTARLFIGHMKREVSDRAWLAAFEKQYLPPLCQTHIKVCSLNLDSPLLTCFYSRTGSSEQMYIPKRLVGCIPCSCYLPLEPGTFSLYLLVSYRGILRSAQARWPYVNRRMCIGYHWYYDLEAGAPGRD